MDIGENLEFKTLTSSCHVHLTCLAPRTAPENAGLLRPYFIYTTIGLGPKWSIAVISWLKMNNPHFQALITEYLLRGLSERGRRIFHFIVPFNP